MATSPGWAQLGSTIAGGNKLPAELAYDQGESLGARTQDALAQARARIDENNAREGIDAKLAPFIADPKLRSTIVGAVQAHVPPEQILNSVKTGQEVGYRADIVDPNTSDADVSRRLFALNQNHEIQKIGPDGQVVNELHPDQGVKLTDIGTSIAGQHNASAQNQLAEAALHRDQVANPGKYRILPPQPGSQGGAGDGSQPIKDDTTAQLVAQGLMPAPAPGSRSYMMLGGEEFTRRVNFLAGPGKDGAAPPAAAPGVVPPGAPKDDGIQLPTEKPQQKFQANFDANTYGQRRTALNDLSRKSGTGGNDDALNRTAGHLDVYEQLMKNANNTNFVAGNKLKNWFQQETGQPFPANANLAAQILGTEIVRSMTSIGAGTGEERGGLAHSFSSASGPDQAPAIIDTAQRLLREQAVATNQRVGASGIKDYYTKYLTPTARRRLSLGEFDKTQAPVGGPAAAPPAPTGASAAPTGKAMSLDDYLKSKGF